jgi:hypothetical protein
VGECVHLSLHQRAGLPFRWIDHRAIGPGLSTPVCKEK